METMVSSVTQLATQTNTQISELTKSQAQTNTPISELASIVKSQISSQNTYQVGGGNTNGSNGGGT